MVGNAHVVAMIANVSRTLETDVRVYESAVRPPDGAGGPAVCDEYVSCNNKLDPFVAEALAIPERFDPSGVAAWDRAKANGTFVDVEIGNVHQLNVHGLRNYMVNPAVHIPILERMCGFGLISDQQKQDALNNFQDVPDQTKRDALNRAPKLSIISIK